MSKKNSKISRGYRLKVSTHSMIKNLQQLTKQTSDIVISRSCTLYFVKLLEENKNIINYKKSSKL